MTERARSVRRALGSIRARVVVGYVTLVAMALAAAVVVVRQVLIAELDRRIEQDLTQEAEEIRTLTSGNDPTTGEPFGADTAAIFDTFLARNVPNRGEAFFTLVDGQPYRYSGQPPAQLLGDDRLVSAWREATGTLRQTLRTEAGETRTLAVPLRLGDEVRGVFVVAAFPEEDLEEIAQAVRILLLASLVVLALSSAAAWGLAGRVIRPVRELTDTAQRVTTSDLSARIPVEGDDELADLGHTFNDMVDRLERGIREQRDFLDDVAHELRTPLTIVRGHLEVLGDDPAERRESIALVTEELDRMSRYVSDLLLLARADEPDFVRPEPVDLGELAESMLHKAQRLADRRWVLDEAPRPGLVAAVLDVDRINQAVLGLADNAAQHTDAGDEIGIGVRAGAGTAELWVRDTGRGVDPEVAEDLFSRRVRGATSRAARPGGTGIGLSIVAAVAKAHGGEVRVDPTPGGGATFTLTLPIDPSEDET